MCYQGAVFCYHGRSNQHIIGTDDQPSCFQIRPYTTIIHSSTVTEWRSGKSIHKFLIQPDCFFIISTFSRTILYLSMNYFWDNNSHRWDTLKIKHNFRKFSINSIDNYICIQKKFHKLISSGGKSTGSSSNPRLAPLPNNAKNSGSYVPFASLTISSSKLQGYFC